MFSASALATLRAAVGLVSASVPPAISFSVTNSSPVMVPACKAFSPYWMPVLSRVSLAAAWPATLPQIDSAHDQALQRAPVGLVTGSYTCDAGSSQLLTAV